MCLVFGQIFGKNCSETSVSNNNRINASFNSVGINVESIQLPFPNLIYPANNDDIYVIGGQPFGLDLYVNNILTGSRGVFDFKYYRQFSPYLAKINPLTMDYISLDISGGKGIPYVGGVVAHSNGFIYAIAKARLFKIDPGNMSIVQFIDLPLPNLFSIYNGVNVASNGNLVTKSFILNDYSYGQFFMIDPDDLEIIDQLDTEVGSARITFDCDSEGNEYMYHINQNYTFRIQVTDNELIIDDTWLASYAPYGAGNNTEPTSPRILNNKVVYTTNTAMNGTNAMKIFWQDSDRPYSLDTDVLPSNYMFEDTTTAGFSFFGLTTDEQNNIMVGLDQANGKIAAYSIDANDQLQYLWEKEYGISSIPKIDSNAGVVYLNDFDKTQNTDYVVGLNLFNGNELARIPTPGTVPSISNLEVGAYNDVYYCSNEYGSSLGYFHRISADSSLSKQNNAIATEISNLQNYPNPFAATTTLEFEVSKSTKLTIDVYNHLGEKINRLYSGISQPGVFTINFDGSEYENGLYFYRVSSDSFTKTGKMVIRK